MRRFFALALCALLLLACVPPVFAAEETVYIRSADDLRALAAACTVDSYSRGRRFVLAADIDLGGETFSPIPVFAGSFDGGSRTVKGLRLDAAASVTGFFRCLTEEALVQRLFVEGEVCPAGEAQTVGGLAGECRGTIRGCGFSGTVRGSRSVGGVAGLCTASGSIESCTVAGLVSGDHAVGGVVGACEGSVRSCLSYAAVGTEEREESAQTLDLGFAQQVLADVGTGAEDLSDVSLGAEELLDVTDIGGVAGWCTGEVRGCANEGEVGYPHIGYNVGGVVGRLSGTAADCVNRGAVFGRKDVGGVVGQLTPAAGWSFTGGRLDELRELLDRLQSASDKLLADATAQNAAMSASLSAALRSLNETSSAAQTLGDEARAWLDENLGAVDSIRARLTKTADGLVPVFDALRGCTEALPQTVQEMRNAYDALWRASTTAASLPYDVQAARLDLDAALQQAQVAAADLSAAAAQLRAGLGDPAAVSAAIAELSEGLSKVSELYGRVAEDLELIYGATADLLSKEDPTDELSQLLLNLSRLPKDLSTAVSAAAELAGGLSGLGGELDAASLDRSLASLGAALLALDTALGSLHGAFGDVGLAAAELAKARPELTNAADALSRAATTAQSGLTALNTATQAAWRLLDALRAQESVAFTPAGQSGESEQALMRSLQDTNAALSGLALELQGTSLLADVRSASDSLFALTEFFVDLYAEPTEKPPADYVEDVSETERTGGGVVRGCRSEADVSADTNVGGVVGAVTLELTLDREDEWNVSGLLSGGMKYLVYAVVRECTGVGAVYAKKEAAGGVVGRMDCGAVLDCEAAGSAETDGSYAGGVVGCCLGVVRGCLARTRLSAARYVGGVVGLGRDVRDCRALPQSLPETEYSGAVAGFADGKVEGNLYAECAIGAVNGMSFAGQAEPVPYETLLAASGESALLRSVTVQFLDEDGVVFASVEVPFGGSVDRLPAVPDRDGAVWVWDDFDNTAIYRGMSVGGRYVRPSTTMSDGAEIPDLLVEGSFTQGQTLTAEAYAPTAETPEPVLDARTVRVTDYEGALTLRVRQSAEGRLYLADASGALHETGYTRDGSYIVFQIENGGSYVFTEKSRPVWPYFAAGGGAAAVAAGAALLIRGKKKKHAAV